MREQTATSDRSWQIVAQKRRRAKTDDLLVLLLTAAIDLFRQLEALRRYTCIHITPQRYDQFACKRHNHRLA